MVRSTHRTTLALFLVTVIIFVARIASASAAVNDIRFNEYTREDGVSEGTITSIVEDQYGYIWVGSVDGLFRFDGYEFKHYQHSPQKPESIPPGFTRTMFVSSNNDLWIGTYTGLAKYLPDTDSFQVYNSDNSLIRNNDIWSISEDANGNILVADTSNLYIIDAETHTLELLDERIDFPDDIEVIRNEPTRIWIGTYGYGAFIYDKNRRQLFPLRSVNPWGINLTVDYIFDIKVIDGEYWIASNEGVLILNNQGEQVNSIDKQRFPDMPNQTVRSISEIEESTVWIGTQDGLGIHNTIANSLIVYGTENKSLTYLKNNQIREIFRDSTGSIWIATYEGLYRKSPTSNSLRLYSHLNSSESSGSKRIWAIEEDRDNALWIATQSAGLAKFDLNRSTVDSYLENEQNQIWDLVVDAANNIWIATSKGIRRYSYSNNTLTFEESFMDNVMIDAIYYDGEQIWTWTEVDGVVSISKSTTENNQNTYTITHHNRDLITDIYSPLYVDRDGNVWLTTVGRIDIFSPLQKKVVNSINLKHQKSQSASIAKSVYEWGNHFWLTTQSSGIYQFEKKTFKLIKHITLDIDSNVILAATGFKDSIWLSTDSAIKKLELPSLSVSFVMDEVQAEYNNYSEGAVSITHDNGIVFGGDKGFHFFYPELLTETSINISESPSSVPSLFSLKVFGKEQDFAAQEGLLDKPLYLKNELSLAHNDSRFSFTFGVVNATSPRTIKYRYRMTGWDHNWTESGTERQAFYNDVSFGDYTFEVQALEDGKAWSDSRSLNITISPPPWLHPAALVFYGFFAAILALYVVRQYHVRRAQRIAVSESEERLKLTLWSSGDELWDWDVFRGQVYRSNTWGTLDFPQDDIRTNSAYDANIHPHDLRRVQEALKTHLDGKTEFFELAYRARTFSNQWVWILDRGKVVQRDHNNQPVRMTGTLKNIQHLKDAEEQLNLFKRSIENISEGVFITDTKFRFISVNNAYCTYTGETREQALASFLYFHQYPEAFTEEIKKTLKARGNWSGEVESTRVNGERYEIELNIDAVHDDDGRISHFVGVFSDITSRKNTEKELLKLANSDPLTELPNRSFFQASHSNLVRKGSTHALLCLDMDNFKKINDSLGHQTGDILIKQIAKRIQRITDANSTCYRLGGDEFSVLMEDISDIHTITHFAQSVLNTLSRPFIINKQEFVLGASIGIALFPEDGSSPQELLKNADTAMYFAKNNGGNSYQFFSGEMNQNAVRQLQIENLIRQGIKDDLFTVYYQPKVDITTGKLVSMEALVRFEHPHKGIVSPGQFIPLAEQTGQIIEIGEQVLKKACMDTKRWVSEGLFSGRVAVNISAKQFELPDLDDRIENILRQVGLSPLHLECEITEGTLMENPEEALRMMQRLRDRGIHLALDDFGTGYSSLAYLKQFPLNTLKIDKAFIDDIANSNVDRHMAAAIINIAHNLGLKVVAEGVEYEEQLNILRRYDCEMLQGFLYSRPLNAERFEKLLKENSLLHKIINKVSPDA